MFDKKDLDKHNEAELIRLIRSKNFDPSSLIFKDTSPQNQNSKSIFPQLFVSNGVFAKEDIEANRIIEKLICIPLEYRSRYHHDRVITNYCWNFGEDDREHGKIIYIVTGNGMIYKHQKDSNTRISFDKISSVVTITAKIMIKTNEEITVDLP